MAEITLSEYCDKAKELVRTESYDQAIAICRHILKHYPKYVRAYRLMGEACLEKGDYVEAASLFKRVLGADMEDMVVRVGLGIVFDEQGALDEAIWQLERAFELSPGNAEIRMELQRLYSDRDGSPPAKLKLTPAALGRLYLREELYQRAIDEFRDVLEDDPERPDVEIALAQALWWSGRRQEAAEICEAILEKYPHSLKANLILGEILLSGDREAEAKSLLDVAEALDPENLVAQALFRDKSPLAPKAVAVPVLDQTNLAEEMSEVEAVAPEGRSQAPRESYQPAGPAQERLDEAMPDWLRKLREEEEESEAEEVAAEPEEQQMPDWLRQLAEERTSEGPEPAQAEESGLDSTADEMPSWLRDLESAPESEGPSGVAEPEAEAPQRAEAEYAPEEESTTEAAVPTPEEAQEPSLERAAEGEEGPEEAPGWLLELTQETVTAEATSAEVDETEEAAPDSLTGLHEEATPHVDKEQETPAPIGPSGLSVEEGPTGEQEPASWAEPPSEEEPAERVVPEGFSPEEYISVEAERVGAQIDEEAMERLRETMPDESASIDEIMSWMERSRALLEEEGIPGLSGDEQREEPAARSEGPMEPAEEELPSWLEELRPTAEAAPEAAPEEQGEVLPEEPALPTPEEELPTWLKELRPEGAVPGVSRPEEIDKPLDQEMVSPEEEEIPTTAQEREPSILEKPSPEDQEAPAWLLSLREEAMEEGQPASWLGEDVTQVEEALAGEGEAPSWLKSLEQSEVVEEEIVLETEEPGTVGEAEVGPLEEEMPSWLRQLRAEEAGETPVPPHEELKPPVAEEPTAHVVEAELPSWLRELREEMAQEGEIQPAEEIASGAEEEPTRPMEEEAPPWLAELSAEARLERELSSGARETPTEEGPSEPLEEEVPSWLSELRAQAAEGETGALMEKAEAAAAGVSLGALQEEELPSWLREMRAEMGEAPAEELPAEEVPSEQRPMPPTQEGEPVTTPKEEVAAPTAPTPEPEAVTPPPEADAAGVRPAPDWATEDYLRYLEEHPRDLDARLELARAYSASGDLDLAAQQYGEILSHGALTEEVVKDLETTTAHAPDHLTTQEALADAYMRSGQLQKALDKYRWLRAMITR
jgi:tetratricopeptide (TPR) repeat protein